MGSAEGCRDCVIPLYKFSEFPPKVLFCDTACHCDEAGLNWLPHYFKHMKKFHDIFHGYAHVCSDVFDSRRGDEYNNIQTSLLEQCNSFLQSLRGLCKSGTTRLATFMFWIEVFVTEWNHRKMINKPLLRMLKWSCPILHKSLFTESWSPKVSRLGKISALGRKTTETQLSVANFEA